jgi:hypothetical protein
MDMMSVWQRGIGSRRLLMGSALLVLLALFGCRSANSELVEAELRDREKQLDELKQELDHRDAEIQGLEAEIQRLQRKLAKADAGPVGSALLVKRITLGRSTGGYDQDPKIPGDEALLVVVEPHDLDDQVTKIPGAVHVDLFEINQQGLEFLISTWDLSAKEVRNNWETPLIGGPAYRLVLPWKLWPNYENLRVVVQFTTPEGQRFQADKKFSIRLPGVPAPEPLHPPRPLQPTLSPPRTTSEARNARTAPDRPVLMMQPGENGLTAPPKLAPATVPAEFPTPSMETEQTSPSPRAKKTQASGVELTSPLRSKPRDVP